MWKHCNNSVSKFTQARMSQILSYSFLQRNWIQTVSKVDILYIDLSLFWLPGSCLGLPNKGQWSTKKLIRCDTSLRSREHVTWPGLYNITVHVTLFNIFTCTYEVLHNVLCYKNILYIIYTLHYILLYIFIYIFIIVDINKLFPPQWIPWLSIASFTDVVREEVLLKLLQQSPATTANILRIC